MLGEIISNYRIVDVLSDDGGMGVVYRAEHVTIGQKVAVKLLRPEYRRNKDLVARSLNEARAAALIDDPGIVRVFDHGWLRDGSPYLMMELLSGESLRARLMRDAVIPWPMASALMRQAARVVGAVHKSGIVHRDLKPENLFLCTDPEMPFGVRLKVLDFGIAKLVHGEGPGGLKTRTGQPLGTLAYMSPEQFLYAKEVDARADIYALGCILYEMLTGR